MTDDNQGQNGGLNPDYLALLLAEQNEIKRNWTVLGASFGGFIFGVFQEQMALMACSAIVLMFYALRIARNFFYLFAPRLPKTRDMVTSARISRAIQTVNQQSGVSNNRTITQDDAINYGIGGIAVGMPFQDFDEPF